MEDRQHNSPCSGSIDVYPKKGCFVDFDVDTTYVIPFTVRNVTSSMLTVRFTPPSNQRVFRINTDPLRLASGLTHVVEAEFITHISQDFKDSFVVFTDKESITVPLVAKCCPDLEFSETIDFGRVEKNRQGLSKVLRLINKGRREKHVSITREPGAVEGLRVTPHNCIVPPLGHLDVCVELLNLDVGKHKQLLQLKVSGEEAQRSVEVTVDVTDFKGVLLDARTGEALHALSFPKTYTGTRQVIGVNVRNEGENPVSFAFQPASDALVEQQLPPFDFEPRQGRLGPHETTLVKAIFLPPIERSFKGWSCRRDVQEVVEETHEAVFSLLFVEMEYTCSLHVSGTSTTTVAWLSQTVVDFGTCAMNDYRDVMVTVHNGHTEMPLHFKFLHIAHFFISPAEGKVKPGSTCEVRLTFRPQRLGIYEEHFPLIFNASQKHMLTFLGVATSIAPLRKILNKVDILPEDFERPKKNVVCTTEPLPIRAFKAVQRRVLSMADTVDIGMVPAEGLEPPEPVLTKTVTCRKKLTKGSVLLREAEHFSPVSLDAKTLIRKVYKEAPTNATERRDCRRELQPVELLRIAAPIKVINYERVTVGSVATKTFFLYNGTGAAVLAEMPKEEVYLSFCPRSQVIPVGRAAAYDVSFHSSVLQTYQQSVPIKVNGRYMLRFSVQADVVPVEVSLSREEVVLQFVDFHDVPMVHATVVLSNHGNSEAAYTWSIIAGVGGSPFAVEPMSGSIAPMSKVTTQLTFTPVYGVLTSEAKAELHVAGATGVKTLKLKGVIPPTVCGWGLSNLVCANAAASTAPQHVLELQKVPAGVITRETVLLHNKGRNNAFFFFESTPEWLVVIPTSGRIVVGETEEIIFAVHHDMPSSLKGVVVCNVHGMKRQLKLNVTAEVCMAPLTILSPEQCDGEILLAFGSVYTGTEKALPVRFKNAGDVAAVICIDLSNFPEYSLRCPYDSAASLGWQGHGESKPGLTYCTIPPQCEASVLFVYCPVAAEGNTRFFVPWKHIGADDMNPLIPLAISARAIASMVTVDRNLLEFPRTVIGTNAVPMSLLIENISAEELHWELILASNDDQNSRDGDKTSSFRIDPDKGLLPRGGNQLVHVMFMPRTVGNRQERYYLCLEDDLKMPCAEISVSGFAALPRIVCDRDELIFPAVPLNVTLRDTMYIINDGFDSIEVFYSGKERGPLTVTFPHGSVSRSSCRIPVCVEFCCQKPVSFSSSIMLSSDKGETLTIPVTGTAISSFITVAPYVSYQRVSSHISCHDCGKTVVPPQSSTGEGEKRVEELIGPFMFYEEAAAISPLVTLTSASSTKVDVGKSQERDVPAACGPFGFVDAAGREIYSQRAIESLRQWSNYNIFQEPVTDLISTLQSTDGRILFDAIYRLCGKRPKQASRVSAKEKSVAHLQKLLSLIKSKGGCLSDVRLSYLMSYETYCRQQEGCEAEAVSQEAFNVRATHAWVTVVLQAIRVAFFPKINLTAILQLYPGMKAHVPHSLWRSASFQTVLHGSNVFSAEESLLLMWVTHNLQTCIEKGLLKEKQRVIYKFDELRDNLGLIACIFVYVPSVKTHFPVERFIQNPMTVGDVENNMTLLLAVLTHIGFPLFADPCDLLEYNAIDWLLLTATLFVFLPRFIPTAVISLEGKLLAPMSRSVEVTNTSSTMRSYKVYMSNSAFRAVPEEFTVDPGGVVHFNVEVTLRFNRGMEGECVLVDVSANVMDERSPIVFCLVASPNDESLRVVHIQTPLYTVLNYELLVESPFAENCVSTLRLAQHYKHDPAYSEGEFGKTLPTAFYISVGVVPFRTGESSKLLLQFAPCARGVYEARITFHDEQQGEFSYSVIGSCTPPKITDKVFVRAEAGEECAQTVIVKLQNVPFERMFRSLEDHRRSISSRPAKDSRMLDLTGIPYSVTFVNENNVGPNPFFRGPDNVMFTSGESMLQFTFYFLPKHVGDYHGFIILASLYDVRTFQLTGKCVPTGEKAVLSFSCPARQSITQGLPIVNKSNANWLIKATIEGANFSGLREFSVPRGKERDYLLRYSPTWISTVKGCLTLHNNETGERRVYALIGEAEEPLCEDAIVIECRAREHRTQVLTVPDVSGADTVYTVETDIPFARGDSSLVVQRSSTAKYSLVLNPMMSGAYSGTVVCRAPNGRYAWYAVTVFVNPPEKEGIVDIRTDTRTPVTADVAIQNPTNKTITFNVCRFGTGLFGENSVVLEAGASSVYSLLFVPSQLGSFNGRISFCSNEIGEFWYELRIVVEEAAPEEIKFSSEIGIPDVAQVRIPNNTAVERSLFVSNSNVRNFSVAPILLYIPPFSELTIDIVYTPTVVNEPQEALLRLFNAELGEWRYLCRGIGHPPAESEQVECVCEVGGRVSVALKFKNPFEVPMIPEATITCGSEGYYTLSEMQSRAPISPGAETSIFLAYTPKCVGCHEATVFVRPASITKGVQNVTWRFPLRGVAEWRCRDVTLRYRCVARRQLEETIKLEAPGLAEQRKKDNNLTVLLELDRQQQHAAAVQASFHGKLDTSDTTVDVLTMDIRFAPLRPFFVLADVVVRSETGAGWRYPIVLDAVRAEHDDVLTIKAALHSTSAILFNMYNVFPHSSPFTAYFTHESSRDLSVTTSRGVLKPFFIGQKNQASSATQIEVRFTPSARLPQVEGTLIVDTEEMQWSYKVLGKLQDKTLR